MSFGTQSFEILLALFEFLEFLLSSYYSLMFAKNLYLFILKVPR